MFRKFAARVLGLLTIAAALLVVAPAPHASAQTVIVGPNFGRDEIGTTKRLGIGLEGGWPFNGVNVKYFLNQGTALQFTVGGTFYDNDVGLGVKGQYLLHPFILLQGPGLTMPFYVGLGVGVGLSPEAFGLNPHGVVGVDFQLRLIPLDFYLQIEPGFFFGDRFIFSPGSAGGIRWFF